MGVQFDSGSFSAAGGGYSTRLTEFTLDSTVDIVIGLHVDENDGSFLVYLIRPRPDGGVDLVQGSAPIDVSGVSIAIRFDAAPPGYYQVVGMTLGDTTTVAGYFTASWENISDDVVGDAEESRPIILSEEPQRLKLEAITQGADALVVKWVEVEALSEDSV